MRMRTTILSNGS
ncbi:hypothetical protein ID866_6306 [Astraeus odoratus]|nr:hypothetical protein ID866_6306 [Astraeus odoratus]